MKRYNKYKPSGIEWAGEVPEHWEVKRGKFCTKLISGFPFDSGKFSYDENDMPLIRIRDIMNGQTEAYYKGSYPEESVVKKGELLIGMDGDFNIARWSGRDGLLNQRVCKLVSTDKLNENYAFYLLERPLKCINDVTYATTVKHLSTFDIYESFLPVPPLAEQEAIAAYLDARCADIDKVVATQQKRIALLQELKQSEITQAVTRGLNPDARMKDSGVEWIGCVPEHWEVTKTLNVLAMPITDGPHETPVLYDEGIPFISAEAVSGGYINFDLMRGYISEEYYNECCKKYIPQYNDIYMIKSGATTGRVAIVETDRVFTIWSPLATFRTDRDRMMPYYLYYLLKSDAYQKQVEYSWTYGTQQNIGMRSLERLKVTIPPLNEQGDIVSYLDRRCGEIDKQIGAVTKQIELLREYKQALITEVVTGKRKV